jgi:GT2 family glycosyltransferase
MNNTKKLLTICVVTYNSSKFIRRCLDNIKEWNVIVIDNKSTDNTLKITKEYNVNIVENKVNSGYGKAANIGIKKAKTKYVLLINPDIYIDNNNIKKMLEYMERHSECDVLGPKLLDTHKTITFSCRRFPNIFALIGNRTGLFKSQVDKYLMKDFNHKTIRQVDWIIGGCMMFKPKYFFDERYFLYFEDTDFCINKRVYYNPKCKATHVYMRDSNKKIMPFLRHTSSYIKYKFKHGILK